jgi:hypothetical protein
MADGAPMLRTLRQLSFEFKKRRQLFIGTDDDALSVTAVRVCCENLATSRINVR